MRFLLCSILAWLLALQSQHVLARLPPPFLVRRQSAGVGKAVNTTSGTIIGHAADNAPGVSEYLGIPFAQPPLGNLRFAAPQRFNGTKAINASAFSPACPANLELRSEQTLAQAGVVPSAFTLFAELDQNNITLDEDCLTLNVWTKDGNSSQSGEKKAVLVWIYGGGFTTGNSNNPQFNGQYFADDADVVLVSFNYRLNIFGFPGLVNQDGVAQNAGLLDQRMAVEWIKDNIEAFGGDPDRITIFGQSAGAASVDYYNYAWVDDPIIAGSIAESGSVTSFSDPISPNNTAAFFNATQNLGCGGPEAGLSAAVACVRTKSTQDLLQAISTSNPLAAILGSFGPSVDNQTVFADYADRADQGQFIKKPYFSGTNDYEAGLFKLVANIGQESYPDFLWSVFNLFIFTCPAQTQSAARVNAGVPTWRYRYFGNYPNTALSTYSDAYHSAEISVVFKTSVSAGSLANTQAESSLSDYMHQAWAAFAKDPENAFDSDPFNFPRYDPNAQTLIEFGQCNATLPTFDLPNKYDVLCPALNTIVGFIPGGKTAILSDLTSSGGSGGSGTMGALLQNFTTLITDTGVGNSTAVGGTTPCLLPQPLTATEWDISMPK